MNNTKRQQIAIIIILAFFTIIDSSNNNTTFLPLFKNKKFLKLPRPARLREESPAALARGDWRRRTPSTRRADPHQRVDSLTTYPREDFFYCKNHSSSFTNSSSESSAAFMIERSVVRSSSSCNGMVTFSVVSGSCFFIRTWLPFWRTKINPARASARTASPPGNYRKMFQTATSTTRAPFPGLMSSSGSR